MSCQKGNLMFHLSESQRQDTVNALGQLLNQKVAAQQTLQEYQAQSNEFNEKLYLEILDVLDAIEPLITYMSDNAELNPKFIKRLPKSFSNIQQKLLSILERRNISAIESDASELDFNVTRVVGHEVHDELNEMTVVKIVRQGFCWDKKVLRPTEVIISKKP
jgi:molecular chaperone GrpE